MNNKTYIIIIVLYLVVLYITCIYYDHQCVKLEEALVYKQTEITSIEKELSETKNNLQSEVENSVELNEALQKVSLRLKEYTTIVDNLKNNEYNLVYVGDFKLTHYCIEKYEHICGTGDGITATGTLATAGRTIAVDPSIIPYGTQVYIEGYGFRIAEDCGGAVSGNHIDIAVDTHEQAINTGATSGGVWVLIQ
jgi:3D (Asp-Asp-Asp) domain-containing protein